jgi:mpaB/rubber oxygenase-like protein
MARSRILDEILRLDPIRDHERICYLSTCFDFPWDTTRSLEIALFRTYCVPRMTEILVSTGEFAQRAQKRYDDTVLILAQLLEWGYDSERGRVAQRIMNRLHDLYPIRNEDFLYVLSTFVYEPIRWNARFGWRPLVEREKLASFHYWRIVGGRMNIRAIPDTYEAFERYNVEYERAEFCYALSNRIIADATMGVFVSWFPAPLRPLVEPCIHAMLDEPVLDAFGYPHPSPALRRSVEAVLKLRARALRRFPSRRRPRLLTAIRHRSYPHGYRVEQLGAAAAHNDCRGGSSQPVMAVPERGELPR